MQFNTTKKELLNRSFTIKTKDHKEAISMGRLGNEDSHQENATEIMLKRALEVAESKHEAALGKKLSTYPNKTCLLTSTNSTTNTTIFLYHPVNFQQHMFWNLLVLRIRLQMVCCINLDVLSVNAQDLDLQIRDSKVEMWKLNIVDSRAFTTAGCYNLPGLFCEILSFFSASDRSIILVDEAEVMDVTAPNAQEQFIQCESKLFPK